jgi:CubicO group peptidase (beta-lactamase class C family)
MRRVLVSSVVAIACLTGLLVLRAAGQAAVPAARGLDEALRAIETTVGADFAKDGVGGLSIGVVSGNRLVWSKHFGFAEAETKRVADNDTDYRIGSITKQFTAVAMLQLVEQQKMQLSDPLEKYVPEIRQVQGLPAGSAPITLLQVATMHSGLSREPECENHSVGPLSGWQQKVISCLPSTTYANTPGTTYLYSNIGYASLGLAIERAGAQPYVEQVAKRIFVPLGMSRSAMEPTAVVRRNLAHGYQRNREGVVSREAPDRELDGRGYRVPNGAIFSTMNDLSKFVSWELGASTTELISKSMQSANYERTFPADSPASAYGVGFQQIRRGDVTMLGHGGSTAGYLSSALFHRASGYGVIVFRNCDSCAIAPGPVAASALETIVKATAIR